MEDNAIEKPSGQNGLLTTPGSEIDGTVECSQCGQKPDDLEEYAQPEVMIMEENFGVPYLFGVRCRICCRVAKAVGRDTAIKRWNAGEHDLDLDKYGNDPDEY